jgi:hypothetical protein
MSSFSSEGPTRYTSALKPDISAPGDAITSTGAGTGTGAATIGGTSMATPHIAGVVALLRQLHPDLSPAEIKALIMNQATPKLENLDGSPVSATIMGAGLVRADQAADAVSLATPGSLSLGLREMADETVVVNSITVHNMDSAKHTYEASGAVRFADFDPAIATVRVGPSGGPFDDEFFFSLKPGKSRQVFVRIKLDPSVISPPEQEYGWFYFHPNVDGQVKIKQSKHGDDTLRVPWHVAPLASSDDSVSPATLDLTGGSATLDVDSGPAAGVSFVDTYLLGATDPATTGLEDDIVAIGARSFTGATIDGEPEGIPPDPEPLLGLGWLDFLTNADTPSEPVEFVVQTSGIHSISDMVETDVIIDVGADGVFADPAMQGDALLVHTADYGSAGAVCLFLLPSTFEACDAGYFADYSVYNSALMGLAVDAGLLGLTDETHVLSYSVTQCSGFPAAIELVTCETVGAIDPATDTWGPTLDVTDPALVVTPQVVGGFYGGGSGPITVEVGSAAPGDDPSLLVVFPNNPFADQGTVVTTST